MTAFSTPRQRQEQEAKKLVAEKDEIEEKINDFESILRSNKVGMKTPLIDAEGYPRADIDIYQIRTARSELAKLYNDLEAKRKEIEKSLVLLHSMPLPVPSEPGDTKPEILKPFGKVLGVLPDSPSYQAGLRSGDLVYQFGKLNSSIPNAFAKISDEVQEFRALKLKVKRDESMLVIIIIPQKFHDNGLLGFRLVPFA